MADLVAKVFLAGQTKFSRAADAFYERRRLLIVSVGLYIRSRIAETPEFSIAWRQLMRVRARRFLRWATPLPSREQAAVSFAGVGSKNAATTTRANPRPRDQTWRISGRAFQHSLRVTTWSRRIAKTFFVSMAYAPGALGGTRTPTILLTATSRQRVYQFRHERLGYRLDGCGPPDQRRRCNKSGMEGQGGFAIE